MRKVIEMSKPLPHSYRFNQTYCMLSLKMVRLVQAALIFLFFNYVLFLIKLFAGPIEYQYFGFYNKTLVEMCLVPEKSMYDYVMWRAKSSHEEIGWDSLKGYFTPNKFYAELTMFDVLYILYI